MATQTAPVLNKTRPRRGIGVAVLATYLGLYAVLLSAMSRWGGFDPSNALGVAAVLGVGFSLAAWALTIGVKPLSYYVLQPARELVALAVYLVALTAVVTWGFDWVRRSFPHDPVQAFALLTVKLIIFVAVPSWLMRWRFGYSWRDLAPSGFSRRHLLVMVAMSALLILFQAVAGSGWRETRTAHLPANILLWGLPLALAWWTLEAGVVEEFFFRCLLQSRLTSMLHSQLGGIVLASLLFGMMHTPGLYLRTSITGEGLAPHPPLWMAIGYSVVITSIAGFVFGILWARTRNFALVAVVHGAADLLPNFLQTMRSLHLWH